MATAPGFVLEGPPQYMGADLPPPYPVDQRETERTVRTKVNAGPQPCPNNCESGTLTQSELEKHLQACPLQMVECEFSFSGCDVKVPRKDVHKHMTESTNKHIMKAMVLNIRLTRDLQLKLEQKDQQIASLQQQVTQLTQSINNSENGFSCHDLVLNNFKVHQARGGRGEWHSQEFTDQLEGLRFKLQIDTNGYRGARDRHLTAWLNLITHEYGIQLTYQAVCIVYLKMLNQLGDHSHHVVVGRMNYINRSSAFYTSQMISDTANFFPLDNLGYNADKKTQYLNQDSLHFRLYLKTN